MTQPEALRLADWCQILAHTVDAYDAQAYQEAAIELRRLHAANIDCVNHFNALMDERNELLGALQGIMHWWGNSLPSNAFDDEMPAGLFDAAHNAIAKATGESK